MAEEKLRIVFMGTPGFAAAILQALLDWDGGEVVAVYSQPDRPCGRGQVCKACEVKELALERGLPVRQPEHFKDPATVAELAALAPDVLVVAAYGLILPKKVLAVPRLMPVNVHASLLPKHRGAAPIQRAILDGEAVTGSTIMRMEPGMDTGAILLQRAMGIDINDTAQSLHDDLARQGGTLLVEALERLKTGALTPIPQDEARATYAPKLSKDDGHIDFRTTAREVHNRARAMFPWPGAFFFWNKDGKRLRVGMEPGREGDAVPDDAKPGDFLGLRPGPDGEALAIACADKAYLVSHLRPAGKNRMDACAFYCGYLQGDEAACACPPELTAG